MIALARPSRRGAVRITRPGTCRQGVLERRLDCHTERRGGAIRPPVRLGARARNGSSALADRPPLSEMIAAHELLVRRTHRGRCRRRRRLRRLVPGGISARARPSTGSPSRRPRASKQRRTAAEKAAEAAALEREEEDRKRPENIEALKNERIGRRFLRRPKSRDEDGVIVTVIDLDQRNPERHVLVENAPVPGAELPVDLPQRLVIDWSRLVEAPEAQMHYTARVLADSHNDADGWLFEELAQGDD